MALLSTKARIELSFFLRKPQGLKISKRTCWIVLNSLSLGFSVKECLKLKRCALIATVIVGSIDYFMQEARYMNNVDPYWRIVIRICGNSVFQLKQEYGYAINPLDPQFAEKIAAKEKEYSKKAKEEKKKLRQDKKAGFVETKAEADTKAQNES